jgi:hypothetical protein
MANVSGHIWGELLQNSSGHPADEPANKYFPIEKEFVPFLFRLNFR